MRLCYEWKSIADVKAKIAAFAELLGAEPNVKIGGTWNDNHGDAVFFDTEMSQDISGVNPVYILVDVDGKQTKVKGTSNSFFILDSKPEAAWTNH